MKYIAFQQAQFMFAKALPEVTKWIFAVQTKMLTPKGFDTATHFTPRYNVWDERVCVVPDADFFRTLEITEEVKGAKSSNIEPQNLKREVTKIGK